MHISQFTPIIKMLTNSLNINQSVVTSYFIKSEGSYECKTD
nr:MAG TPA: hypothetical protein [Caudoviricetes sp.]